MKIDVINESCTPENFHQIIKRIFLICKNEPSFSGKEKISCIEENITSISSKATKQNDLLQKGTSMVEEIQRKIKTLEEENFEIRGTLLEKLGSEL